MNTQTLEELLQLAEKTVGDAGHVINTYDSKKIELNYKGKGGSLAAEVVTEVDLKIQALIEKSLAKSIHDHKLGFLGEESADSHSRFKRDYFWVVDPIDGTLPFCEGKPGYSVSIALVCRNGVPMIGAVFDPVSGKLYSAAKGLGAFINEKKISINSKRKKHLTIYLDRSSYNENLYQEAIDLIVSKCRALGFDNHSVTTKGGAVMKACWLLENPPGIFFKLPKEKGGSLWDYAATACIYQELKLPANDIYGNSLDLNRKESTYMNHKGLVYASHRDLSEAVKNVFSELVG